MAHPADGRRDFVRLGGIALAASALTATVDAQWSPNEWNATEKANVKVVQDVFRAWEKRDGDTIERLFAPDAVVRFVRVEGTTPPWNGAKAIRKVAEGAASANVRFTIARTLAEGPIVVIRRIDRFTDASGAHCAHHGLKDMAVC